MRYKIKNILSAGLLCVALLGWSCVREEGGSDHRPEPLSPEGMVSFRIDVSDTNPRTRVSSNPGVGEEGTPEENFVEKVRMVLYGDDGVVKYAFDYHIRSTTGDGEYYAFEEHREDGDRNNYLYESSEKGAYDLYFVTYARQIARADYDVLVILNPSQNTSGNTTYDALDLYKLTEPGCSLADYQRAVEISQQNLRTRANGGIAEDNYFLMTNHRGLVHVPAEWFPASETGAHEKPLSVEVSRAVAKVLLISAVDDVDVYPRPAWIDNLTWGFDVTNKKTYWQRKLTYLVGRDEMEQPQSPIDDSSPPRNELYAEDPNFNGFSIMSGAAEQARKDNFDYLKYAPVAHPELPVFTAGPWEWDYCLENTMENSDRYSEVITHMIIRCQYFPPSYNRGESYFVYEGYIIDVPTMQAIYNGNPPAGIPSMPGLGESLRLAAGQLGAEYNFSDMASFPRSFSAHGVRYYHDAYNYFFVRLTGEPRSTPTRVGDDNDNGGSGFGVIRNNIYGVTIEQIYGPGTPTIEQPETGNIAASVKVLPWQVRGWETEL